MPIADYSSPRINLLRRVIRERRLRHKTRLCCILSTRSMSSHESEHKKPFCQADNILYQRHLSFIFFFFFSLLFIPPLLPFHTSSPTPLHIIHPFHSPHALAHSHSSNTPHPPSISTILTLHFTKNKTLNKKSSKNGIYLIIAL